MQVFFSIFLYLSLWIPSAAQEYQPDTPCNEIRYELDETNAPTLFDKEKITAFQEDSNFNYSEEISSENLWTRFKNWLSQWLSKFLQWAFDIPEITGNLAMLLGIIPYLLFIGLLVLTVWLFMKINPSTFYKENLKNPEVLLTEDEDIIQNQNIETLIAKAIAQKNYRLAIRYYYLAVLKSLKDHELINWQAQKTNSEYLNELQETKLQNQFQQLTRFYDFIWYGGLVLDESSFYSIENAFKKIFKELNQSD